MTNQGKVNVKEWRSVSDSLRNMHVKVNQSLSVMESARLGILTVARMNLPLRSETDAAGNKSLTEQKA